TSLAAGGDRTRRGAGSRAGVRANLFWIRPLLELGLKRGPLGEDGGSAGAGARGEFSGGGRHLRTLHGHGGGHGFAAYAIERGWTCGSCATAAAAESASPAAAAAGGRSGGELIDVGHEGRIAGGTSSGAGLFVRVVERNGGVVHLGGERVELLERS